MDSPRVLPFALCMVFFGSLLAFTPTAQAAEIGFDDFESYDFGETPDGAFWTTAYQATSYVTNEVPAASGDMSFKTATRGGYLFQSPGTTFCNSGQSVSFAIKLEDIVPSAATEVHIGITAGGTAISGANTLGPGQFAGLKFKQAGVVTASIVASNQINDQPFVGTYEADTWYNVTIGPMGCDLANSANTGVRSKIDVTFNGELVVETASAAFSSANNLFTNLNTGTSGQATPATVINYLDDLLLESSYEAAPGVIFCANPAIDDPVGTGDDPDYGYSYRRGGNFEEDGGDTVTGLDSKFVFTGGSSETGWDYSAKSLTASTRAAHVNVTLESGFEGSGSIYRVAFGLDTGGNLASVTTKGNGIDTGNFANHIEAQFLEYDNKWQVSIWYVEAGGARTQLGAAALYGNSNDATPFTVWLDTRPLSPGSPARAPHDDFYFPGGGLTTAQGPWAIVSVPGSGPLGEDNQILVYRNLATLTGNPFLNLPIYDFWHIGAGDGLGLLTGGIAETALDNNEQTGPGSYDSTCIFDDEGTAIISGDGGLEPGSSLPGGDDDDESGCIAVLCVDSADVPTGFTVATFNGMMGMLLVGMVAIGGVGALQSQTSFKVGGGALVLFAALGYMIGLYMGLLPLWPIVALVVLAVGYVIIRMRSGG